MCSLNEIWEDVDNCNGQFSISNLGGFRRNYSVSKLGKVRKLSGTIKPQKTKRGYMKVKLVINGVKCATSVHRLMALAFIPNPDNYPIVRHLNDIKDDNRLENLAWGTDKDNADDAQRNGKRKIKKEIPHKEPINPFKEVINTQTREVFRTNELAEILGIKRKELVRMLNGERYNKTVYRYVGMEDLIKQAQPKKCVAEKIYKIAVFDMNWDLLKKFDYMSECLLFVDSDRSGVVDFLNGKCSHRKGFKFKRIDDNGQFIEPILFEPKKRIKIEKVRNPVTPSKKVRQYSIDNTLIKEHDSIGDAAKSIFTDKKQFRRQIVKSKTGYCKGFNWVVI